MFDLRPLYNFDASEGQIPEGNVSVYGQANSHANCVPASFTAALDLAGYGDIDPQRLTNEIYGPNYRGGFGDFSKTIAWVRKNIPNPPSLTDGPFDFNAAEAAGQAGQLIIVAGWINAASVTFTAQSNANGFSHASLLVAHLGGGKYVIWNTWTGQMQTYDQAVLAASLYEMSVMTAGLHGGGVLGFTATRNAPKEASAIVATLNSINLFGRGTDNALWHLRFDGDAGTWGAWHSLGGGLLAPDIAVTQRGDQIDVFVIGLDGGTDHIWSTDEGATWSQYETHGGKLSGSLVAVASEPDRLDEQILAAINKLPAGSVASVDLKPVLDAIAALKFPTTISGKLA